MRDTESNSRRLSNVLEVVIAAGAIIGVSAYFVFAVKPSHLGLRRGLAWTAISGAVIAGSALIAWTVVQSRHRGDERQTRDQKTTD